MDPTPGVPLTRHHLGTRSSGRFDKDSLINSYLREQRRHARAFAAEGKEVVLSWTTLDRQKQDGDAAAIQAETHGFDTPVLKPRVSRPCLGTSGASASEGPRQDSLPKSTLLHKQDHKENRAPHKQDGKTKRKQQKQPNGSAHDVAKRANLSENSDDDRAARLAERRGRKRAKRAIVRPLEMTTSEQDRDDSQVSQDKTIEKKSKGDKSKKQSLLTGLALMHGFTATNVGKNRLTLKPSINFGVFNKGKASAKVQVTKQKSSTRAGRLESHFSESRFLNSTRMNPSKVTKNRMTRSRSETILSGPQSQSVSIEEISSKNFRKLCSSSDVVDNHAKRRKASFELWDIELESPQSRKASSAEPSREGTVVIDTCTLPWADLKRGPTKGNTDELSRRLASDQEMLGSDNAACVGENGVKSSPSLCPSQSASQACRRSGFLGSGKEREIASKYFLQGNSKHLEDPTILKTRPAVSTGAQTANSLTQDLVPRPDVPDAVVCEHEPRSFPTIARKPRFTRSLPEQHADRLATTRAPSPSSSLNSVELALRDYEVDNLCLEMMLHEPTEAHQMGHLHSPVTQGSLDDELDMSLKYDEYEESMQNGRQNAQLQYDWITLDATDSASEDSQLCDSAGNCFPFRCFDEDIDDVEVNSEYRHEYLRAQHRLSHYDDGHYQNLGPEADILGTVAEQENQLHSRPGTDCSGISHSSESVDSSMPRFEQFCQGRTLLRGSVRYECGVGSRFSSVSRVEADVAKCLRGHWQPQRL